MLSNQMKIGKIMSESYVYVKPVLLKWQNSETHLYSLSYEERFFNIVQSANLNRHLTRVLCKLLLSTFLH